MTDHLSKEDRSWNMSRIRSKNTKPEKKVRSALHKMGFRFRIGVKELPGKPDIVLPKHRTIIFVHGCFWHRHKGCKRCTTPSSNPEYWLRKFQKNTERDVSVSKELQDIGWRVIIIWECEVKGDFKNINNFIRARIQIK